jgi:hypothetical protein
MLKRIAGKMFGQKLQRHVALKLRIACTKYDTHPACAKW